MQDGNW